jgi:hypothetical protein
VLNAIAYVLLGFVLVAKLGFADDRRGGKDSQAAPEILQIVAEVVDSQVGLIADVDLGSLPVGKEAAILIKLANPLDTDLPMLRMETSCSCLKIHSDDSVLPAQGFATFKLQLNVPEKSEDSIHMYKVTLFYDNENSKGITIAISYKLAGLLAFKGTGFVAKLPPGNEPHVFRIPFHATEPISLEDLVLTSSDSLGGPTLKLSSDKENQYLECLFKVNATQSKFGSVSMTDKKSGKSASIDCILEVVSQVEIAPNHLQFRRKKPDNNSKEEPIYSANCVIKVDDSLINSKNGKELTPTIDVVSESETWNFTLTSKRVAKGMYRSTVSAKLVEKGNADASVFPASVQIKVTCGNADVVNPVFSSVDLR